MQTNNYLLNTNPSKQELNTVLKWLENEYESYGEGFYCNKEIIERSFEKDELITFGNGQEVIAFLVFRNAKIHTEIEIFVVAVEHRGRGLGKIFFEQIENHFRSLNSLAFKLYCQPIESHIFWEAMGFEDFPDIEFSLPPFTYFKRLYKNEISIAGSASEHKIELWNLEEHEVHDKRPKWTWKFSLENGKLNSPILQPFNPDWHIRWSKKDKVVWEGKVKRFNNSGEEYCYDPFLFIASLTE